VKYTKKYWVSELCKITNKFNTSRTLAAWDRYPVTAISGKCAESLLHLYFLTACSRFQLFPFQETLDAYADISLDAVPFEIPILEKGDGKRRSFSEWKNWYLFIDLQKTKVDQSTATLIYRRLPYCLNVVNFIRALTSCSCKTVLRHTTQKLMNGQHILQILFFRLLHLGYPAGFGVRRPTTSICKSTGPQWGNEKQAEGGHHWDSSKIHCTMEKNDCMLLESRMEARFSTFSTNRCDWISISCSETCWLIGYFVHCGHPILFCVFHC